MYDLDRRHSFDVGWGWTGCFLRLVILLHQGGGWLVSYVECFPQLKSPPHCRTQEIAWG